jgi:pimeloyl-ACP methyl ester carboxylesterase
MSSRALCGRSSGRLARTRCKKASTAGGVTAGQQAWLRHPLFAGSRRDPDLTAQLAAMVSDYPGQHWLGQDPAAAGPLPPAEVLGGLTMPALVVAGDQDMPCFLEMTETLARGIPGAELR